MILGFLKVFVTQRISVHDDNSVAMEQRKLLIVMCLRMIEMTTECTYLQGCCIHRYYHIRFVAGCVHFAT